MKTVLVVDDSSFIRLRVKEILYPLGIKVIERDSGESLLNLLNNLKIKIDLIILDIFMPGIDGLDTVAQIKAIEACRYIPIIIMTGYPKSNIVIKAIKLGVQDFIVKPIDEEKFRDKVSKILKLDTPPIGYIKISSDRYLDIEMKRAARGKTVLTSLGISVKKIKGKSIDYQILESLISGMIEKISEELIESMRETDVVFKYSEDKILVVLPLTEASGLPSIEAKVRLICDSECGEYYEYKLSSNVFDGNVDKPYNILAKLFEDK